MKKLFSFLLVFFFGLVLIGCNGEEEKAPAKITYVDPSTGEEVEMEIAATEDAAEIADIVSKLQPTTEMPEGIAVTGNITMTSSSDAKMDLNGTTMSFKVEENLDANLEAKTNLVDKHYVDASFSYVTKNNGAEVAEMSMSAEAIIYGDAENLYVNATAMGDTAKVYMPIDQLIEMIGSMIEGAGSEEVAPMAAEDTPSFDEMTPEQLIEFLNLSINSTTANTIEFKLPLTVELIETISGEDIPFESTKSVDIYVTVQADTLLPTKLKIDASEFIKDLLVSYQDVLAQQYGCTEYVVNSAKLTVEFEFTYGAISDIPTLTDAQKAEYSPAMDDEGSSEMM